MKPSIINKSRSKPKGKTPLKRSVKIADYDPKWPVIFAEERNQILSVLKKKVVAIEHIGSTAVQGLGAKPINLRFAAWCGSFHALKGLVKKC
jgi:hypothetical protein